MNLRRATLVFVSLLAVLRLTAGCIKLGGLEDQLGNIRVETVNALNDAIGTLQGASADWQKVLTDTMAKLTREAQSTVRNEIANVMSRSIAQAGVELRCDADFIRGRIVEELVAIKARFLHQTVPAVEPGLCQVVPLAVDRELVPDRLKQIEFYGYNFTEAPGLGVFLVRNSGERVNVTSAIDRPTHYAMTLKFGANGVQLDPAAARFTLEWGGRQISSIAIIQPTTPVCESKVQPVQLGIVGPFVPPKVGTGDADFSGNGPDVYASVSLSASPQALAARVYMHAKETKSDWTEAEGWREYQVYSADPGWRIDRIAGKTSSSMSYRDSTTTEDSFDLGAGDLAKRFVFTGDTRGDEAGTRSGVKVFFNPVQVVLTETSNCVPDTALRHVLDARMLSDVSASRLRGAADRQAERRRAALTHPVVH